MDIVSCKKRVSYYLENRPATRDDDRLLYRLIIEEDLNGRRDILDAIERGEVTFFESVTRCRRKLQEQYDNLRGELWDSRHAEEKNVQEQLYFEF